VWGGGGGGALRRKREKWRREGEKKGDRRNQRRELTWKGRKKEGGEWEEEEREECYFHKKKWEIAGDGKTKGTSHRKPASSLRSVTIFRGTGSVTGQSGESWGRCSWGPKSLRVMCREGPKADEFMISKSKVGKRERSAGKSPGKDVKTESSK